MLTIRNKIPAMLFCLAVLGPQTTLALTEQQQSMLNQLDQLDNLDLLDSDAKANACIMSQDFTCAEKEIAKASRLARTQQQKTLIQLTLQNLAMERSLLEAQQQARRDREEAEYAARVTKERATRAQERAQEEAENNQRLKLAAMSAGFILGGGGELSAERQAAVFQAIAQDSYGSGASNVTSAMNNIKAQQQAQSQQQAEMLAEQRALQERQVLARTAAANEQSASRQVTRAPRSSVDAVSKQAPQIVEYVTQTVVIPDWSTPCPPGYKPAQENGRNITAGSGGGYCLKDSTSQGQNAGLASNGAGQRSMNNQVGQQGNSQSAQETERQKVIQKAELAERKRQEKIELEKSLPEALAFCWQAKNGNWSCDGPSDETSMGDNNQDAQLANVGCKKPSPIVSGQVTLTSVRVAKRGNVTGWLYSCGNKLQPGDTGVMTWNRDIRRFWSGMPNSAL